MKPTPKTMDGKNLIYEEVFRSPFARATEDEARKVLEDIRSYHPASSGWVEIESNIDKTSEGYVAWRKHAKYG